MLLRVAVDGIGLVRYAIKEHKKKGGPEMQEEQRCEWCGGPIKRGAWVYCVPMTPYPGSPFIPCVHEICERCYQYHVEPECKKHVTRKKKDHDAPF
jgi:hypothetical protein